jgi:Oxidoreductase family, NAD-binding Rossmann fold
MKKIGFIDHYIDNWHSNHFPQMIRESAFKDEFEIALAWEETTPPGKKPLVEWCKEYGVTPARSLEQVVDTCDVILVLSPDDADRHLPLAQYALRSGKPVCIDKPFADKIRDAREMFDLAAKLRTPLMSSSSLRFTPALTAAKTDRIRGKKVHYVSSWGGGRFPVYIVHILEMLVTTIGTGARRVMSLGERAEAPVLVVDYPDKRRGLLQLYPGLGFGLAASYGDGESLYLADVQGFYEVYIQAVLDFFMTGVSPVPQN